MPNLRMCTLNFKPPLTGEELLELARTLLTTDPHFDDLCVMRENLAKIAAHFVACTCADCRARRGQS